MADRLQKYVRLMVRFRLSLILLFFGIGLLALSFAFLMILIYRNVALGGAAQEVIYVLTLQFLPHLWRFVILFGLGGGVILGALYLSGRGLIGPFRGYYTDLAEALSSHDLRSQGPRIVCIGGGIGTAQLIRGLKQYAGRLSVVVHMTDDGGSTGRLRRSLGLPPLGDIVSNIVALSDAEDLLKQVLLYRFKGERYGGDNDLSGHKLGNLLFAAMADVTGDLNQAIEEVSRVFAVRGEVLPVTQDNVFLRARTRDGIVVEGEENIDLGRYDGEKVLEEIWYEPKNAKANPKVIEAIEKADIIVLGPGDLYTTILSNLIFKEVTEAVARNRRALKAFVLNVANKPYETRGYELRDFIEAFRRHGAERTFDHILVNSNHDVPIPDAPEYEGYSYVNYDVAGAEAAGYRIVEGDYLERFMGGVEGKGVSIYHESGKVARTIIDLYGKTKG